MPVHVVGTHAPSAVRARACRRPDHYGHEFLVGNRALLICFFWNLVIYFGITQVSFVNDYFCHVTEMSSVGCNCFFSFVILPSFVMLRK